MGFYINDEQKVRISLSNRAHLVLTEDMDRFGVAQVSTLMNLIFTNYKDEAKASLSLYLQERKVEIEQTLSSVNLEDETRSKIINSLLDNEKSIILTDIEKLKSQKGDSKIYHINDCNCNYLIDECNEDIFYSSPGVYIKSVVEEYASLPFIYRERIIRKDVFERVERACKEHTLMKVKTLVRGKDQYFYVYPYKIVPDQLHTQSYLVCYSRMIEENEDEKIVVSFNMARINPISMKKKFFLNKKEVDNIESQLIMHSATYLVGKPERIEVKLTDRGKKLYQTKLFSRPEKIVDLSNDEKYVFVCSPRQIFNYFFSFGPEVEILFPQSLRRWFADEYAKALEIYREEDTVISE